MSIGKISKRAGTAQLIIKSKYGQNLNEREVFAINSGEVSGLMPFDVIKKKKTTKLIYDVTGHVTLKGFLRSPINKNAFAGILSGIIKNLNEIRVACLNANYVLFDLNRVLVNPSTKKIKFIYVPIQSFETNTDLKELLRELAVFATFSANEDNRYVEDYFNILNSGINFSLFDLEEFVRRISISFNGVSQQKIICPRCNAVLPGDMHYCSVCGTRMDLSRKGTGQEKEYVPPIDYSPGPKPYLISARGEKIAITKQVFTIGKDDRVCDYCIRNNTAVSRRHAEISAFNNHYFLTDKKSTNKTYINNQPIEPECQFELIPGMRIKIANEEFTFTLQ